LFLFFVLFLLLFIYFVYVCGGYTFGFFSFTVFVYPYFELALWVSLSGSCGQDTGNTNDPGSPGREEHNCFQGQTPREKIDL
jgi:hypothetical protein